MAVRFNPKDRATVLDRLRYFDAQLGELIDLVSGGKLDEAGKTDARDCLRDLKDKLASEARRSESSPSPTVQAFLLPAVTEAAAHIRIRSNSDPNGSGWMSDLYEARVDIQFYLDDLASLGTEGV